VGLTGTTGLALGDHLHYSVLVHGSFVNPLEWWDAHWFKDQVEKVAAGTAPPAADAGQAAPSQEPAAPTKKGRAKKAKKGQR
jgi:murein DD-endopeptidase MepM/ murein hydrolase activator NlpD